MSDGKVLYCTAVLQTCFFPSLLLNGGETPLLDGAYE